MITVTELPIMIIVIVNNDKYDNNSAGYSNKYFHIISKMNITIHTKLKKELQN